MIGLCIVLNTSKGTYPASLGQYCEEDSQGWELHGCQLRGATKFKMAQPNFPPQDSRSSRIGSSVLSEIVGKFKMLTAKITSVGRAIQ